MATISITMPLNPTITIGPGGQVPPTIQAFGVAAEAGIQLQIGVNVLGSTTYNILAATAINLTIQEPNGTVIRVLPMTSDPTGNYALRTLVVTDFPYAGIYTAQLSAAFSGGILLLSQTQELVVSM